MLDGTNETPSTRWLVWEGYDSTNNLKICPEIESRHAEV